MPPLSVRMKLLAARMVSSSVMASRRITRRDPTLHVWRGGVCWELDLSETIDFSIFLLGAWEHRTQQIYRRGLTDGCIALDIGANVGAHSLPMARLVGPSGRIIAVEPTALAFRRLCRNISLNPNLATRIVPLQMAMLAHPEGPVPKLIHSSWPIHAHRDSHPVHSGRLQHTTGAAGSSVDALVHALSLPRVDYLKIDVDGAEPGVLIGARGTLARWRPRLLLEWSDSLQLDCGTQPDEALSLLGELGYRIRSKGAACGTLVSRSAARMLGPNGCTWSALLESGSAG